MKQCAVSAPGKLIVCGEYAVLAGAPALVLALNRRAGVHVRACQDHVFRLHAPDIGVHGAQGQMRNGRMQWRDVEESARARVQLVTRLLESCAARGDGLPALEIDIDTAAFVTAAGDAKLGLGSSAAVTVALASALACLAGRDKPALPELIETHRSLQHGRGSGADVAAALQGGAQVFQWRDGVPVSDPLAWPADLHWRMVWSGRSASTSKALASLARWRHGQPQQYHGIMDALCAASKVACDALGAGRVLDVLDVLKDYAGVLQRLGEASGIDIVSAEHRAIAAVAADCGVLYKTCGAGGGDTGLLLSADADALAACSMKLQKAGYGLPTAAMDPLGVDVQAERSKGRRS